MWRGEAGCTDDYDGQSVRIYQPILYGGSRKARFDDPTCSCIGGPTSNALRCPQCQDPLYPLVKISTKTTDRNNGNNRTLQVWACNRVACTRKLFEAEPATSDDIETSTDNAHRGLCYGGGKGVVVCRRILTPTAPQPLANESLLPPVVKAAPTSSHNEWAMSMDGTTTSTGDLDDLESKLAAMETNATGSSSKAKPSLNAKPSIPLDRSGAALVESSTGFPIYELHSLPEPLPVRSTEYPMDDDDVGFASSGRGIDDKKIQQMLSQYMAMEDDQDILAALRGTNASGHPAAAAASAGGYGERDERLSAHDRALWTFQDRLKRAPRQVVRYALGGVPMWSM